MGANDRQENPFLSVARHFERDVIVLNNPTAEVAKHLDRDILGVREIHLIRDGRALLASYLRKFPRSDVLGGLFDFMAWSFNNFEFALEQSDKLYQRYEDVSADPELALNQVGDFLNIAYSPAALRFWEHEHHPIAGNVGPVSIIKIAQDIPLSDYTGRQFYQDQHASLLESGGRVFRDERWQEELSRRERFVFDIVCGDANQRFGYQRDVFQPEEIHQYGAELWRAIKSGELDPAVESELHKRAVAGGVPHRRAVVGSTAGLAGRKALFGRNVRARFHARLLRLARRIRLRATVALIVVKRVFSLSSSRSD